MQQFNTDEFMALLKAQRVGSRLVRDIRFNPDHALPDHELLAVLTRSGNEGVLLVNLDADLYVLAFELMTNVRDNTTGRAKPITCDFCYTWQQGDKAGRITFMRASDGHKFTFLCCGDLQCSSHVRGLTSEALLSRTQLHEDMTPEQRAARLRTKLADLITLLDASPAI